MYGFRARTNTPDKIDFTTGIWWEEIGRATLTTAGDTVSVAGMATRKYLRLQIHILNSGLINGVLRFNTDSGANYTLRYSTNGTFGSAVSQTAVGDLSSNSALSATVDIINVASSAKVGKVVSIGNISSAGTAPSYVELWFSWVNASSQINRIDLVNTGVGDFAAGTQVVVLGHN